MSSAYHPQTDGQTERANRTLEQMLRFFVDKQLSNWDEMLLCCEFAYNNSEQVSTGLTPFYLNYGMHPLTPAGLIGAAATPVPDAAAQLAALRAAQSNAKAAILEAQRRQKAYADKSRSDVIFATGDKVLLKLKGRPQQKGPAQKLRPERAGPFTISEIISPVSTRLDMSPANWRGLDIFHNSQLTRYHDGVNLFPSRTPETVQPCDVAHLDDWDADNEEFAVSEIKAARRDPQAGCMKWLVGFRGYAADSDLWIEDSQMNELLRAEARTRNAELLAEGERITLLEAAAAANRAQPRGRQCTAVSGTAPAGDAPPLRRPRGRPRKTPLTPAPDGTPASAGCASARGAAEPPATAPPGAPPPLQRPSREAPQNAAGHLAGAGGEGTGCRSCPR